MIIAVLGATGTLGVLLTERLRELGHEVKPVSRTHGYDLLSSSDAARAVEGVDTVIDCLNIDTLNRKQAVDFFTRVARNVTEAAKQAGVKSLICVSIYGVNDPAVARGYGYFEGKAAQERIYRESGLPVTVVQSTQWFELVPKIVAGCTVGPIAVLPKMRFAPIAAAEVAQFIVQKVVSNTHPTAETPSEGSAVAGGVAEAIIKGPENYDLRAVAEWMLSAAPAAFAKQPRVLWQLPYLGSAIAGGTLVPSSGVIGKQTLSELYPVG